jgi:hypothetical protein
LNLHHSSLQPLPSDTQLKTQARPRGPDPTPSCAASRLPLPAKVLVYTLLTSPLALLSALHAVPSDNLGRIATYRLPTRAHARALPESVIDVRRPNLGLSTLSRCARRLDSDTRLKTQAQPYTPVVFQADRTWHDGDVPLPHQPPTRTKEIGRRVDPRSLHGRYMRRPPLFSAYWRAALLMSASVGTYAVRHGSVFRVPCSAAQRAGSLRRALLPSPPFSPPTPWLPPSPQSQFIPLRLSAMCLSTPHLPLHLSLPPSVPARRASPSRHRSLPPFPTHLIPQTLTPTSALRTAHTHQVQ